MIRDRLFRALARLATTRARYVAYLLAALLTVGSILLVPRLEIHTTRQGMVSDELPVQAALTAFMHDFGSPSQLVLVLEGDPSTIKPAADAVARRLLREPDLVRNVFYRIDYEAFHRAGLYYLDLEILESAREFLADDPERATALLSGRDLTAALAALEAATGGLAIDSLDSPSMAVAFELLAGWQAVLEGADRQDLGIARSLESAAAELAGSGLDPEGYLLSTDRQLAFLFIQQTQTTDEASYIMPFMSAVRDAVAEALVEHPEVTAGFTGWPAAIAEDYALLLTDLPRISLIASIAILAIFLLTFRSLYRTVLVFVPLLCGVAWTLGLTVLTVGHLNYLSSVFVGVLFGMGIDFGIYFVRRFDEERLKGAGPETAVQRTLMTAGQGVATGGLATVAAFMAIGLTDQPAFSELGLVAGMGVAAVLAATLLLLPPLLVQFPPGLGRARAEVASPFLAAAGRAVLRRPGLTLTGAVLLAAFCLVAVPRLGFDYNLNSLLPADSETVRVLRDMEQRSPYSDQFIAVIADDLDQVRRLQEILGSADTVSRVESLASVLPEQAAAKEIVLGELQDLASKAANGPPAATDAKALRRRIDALIARLEEAEEDAFAAGLDSAVEVVGRLLDRFAGIAGLLRTGGDNDRQLTFENLLFGERDRLMADAAPMLAARPIDLTSLDPSLRERFVGASGRMLVMAFPVEPIWDRAFLDRFVGQVREGAAAVIGGDDLDSRVTGFAVGYHVTAPAIRRGFTIATWASLAIVALMLLVDLRSLAAVMVAATPLAATAIVLLGGMAWLDVPLNMASQVAFPILFGLGVAYGLHMIHRLREVGPDDAAMAVGTTGKAIALAAATTMAGFGAMLLADHSALADFGLVLFLGILISAVTALFIAPPLFALLTSRQGPRR